ncbi:hypothetical protein DPMN_033865 [Dreissena polymorpha]|uniref:Uncharacterized protein n=1 Tax=Dreissena polymorpha TaxID=45954 RepID=A0A9D4RLJ1_DREPO|nr:hypothetical protein DPMN_033865 [Dreissena polymorpha]
MIPVDDVMVGVYSGRSVSLPCCSGTVRVGAVLIASFAGLSVLVQVGPRAHRVVTRDDGLLKTVEAKNIYKIRDDPGLPCLSVLIWDWGLMIGGAGYIALHLSGVRSIGRSARYLSVHNSQTNKRTHWYASYVGGMEDAYRIFSQQV